jgi:hypothetical protein
MTDLSPIKKCVNIAQLSLLIVPHSQLLKCLWKYSENDMIWSIINSIE